MSLEIFTTWRAEITVELANTQADLNTATVEHRAAKEVLRVEREERELISVAFTLLRHLPLAGPLAIRCRAFHDRVAAAEGAVTRTRGKIEALVAVLADKQAALDQLDLIAPQQAPAEAPAHEFELA